MLHLAILLHDSDKNCWSCVELQVTTKKVHKIAKYVQEAAIKVHEVYVCTVYSISVTYLMGNYIYHRICAYKCLDVKMRCIYRSLC